MEDNKFYCKQCEKMIDKDDFYSDPRRIFGIKAICKHCMKKNYLDNREKKLEYQNEYNRKNWEKIRKYQSERHFFNKSARISC